MKKVLAIAFIASLFVVNCSKKPDHSLQDSNTMLEEPEVTTVVDSAASKSADTSAAPAALAPEAATTDSAAVK